MCQLSEGAFLVRIFEKFQNMMFCFFKLVFLLFLDIFLSRILQGYHELGTLFLIEIAEVTEVLDSVVAMWLLNSHSLEKCLNLDIVKFFLLKVHFDIGTSVDPLVI